MMNKCQNRIVYSVFCCVWAMVVVVEGNVTCLSCKGVRNQHLSLWVKVLVCLSSTLLFCRGCVHAQVMMGRLNTMIGAVLPRHYRKQQAMLFDCRHSLQHSMLFFQQ